MSRDSRGGVTRAPQAIRTTQCPRAPGPDRPGLRRCDNRHREVLVPGRISGRLVGFVRWCSAIAIALALASPVLGRAGTIPVLPATGVVDNVMAGYLEDGIARAAADGAPAVVIRLNTPGGSLDATQRIVSALLESTVPTIVWVSPAGGRAASAGTFITLAANLAYMAPGTNIGAASPIDSSGQDIPGTLGLKVKNDAIANIRSIAEARGRNADWAVSTVATAVSSSASEAVALHAVDGIAATLDDLRTSANGRVVTVTGGRQVTLDLAGATFGESGMNPFQGFLHLLSDPNIAFLLFSLGGLALLLELFHPNFVSGTVGAIAVILGLVGFGSLPLNAAGLLLVGLGIVLLGLEIAVTSHGLLGAGGVACFVVGASVLYTPPGDPFGPVVDVALPLLAVMTATAAAFTGLIMYTALQTRRMVSTPGLVGTALEPGTPGIVGRPLDPLGSVSAGGEEWSARAVDGRPIGRGERVRVVALDGLTVLVERDLQSSPV
jgi:membrane-bound serine protease (ClpP class)